MKTFSTELPTMKLRDNFPFLNDTQWLLAMSHCRGCILGFDKLRSENKIRAIRNYVLMEVNRGVANLERGLKLAENFLNEWCSLEAIDDPTTREDVEKAVKVLIDLDSSEEEYELRNSLEEAFCSKYPFLTDANYWEVVDRYCLSEVNSIDYIDGNVHPSVLQ